MNVRVMLIGLTAVALLVGILELASIATERVTGAPAPSVFTHGVGPELPSVPELDDVPAAASPALTH